MTLADSGGHGHRLVLPWLTVVSWSQARVTLADSGGHGYRHVWPWLTVVVMVIGMCGPG